MKGVLAALAAVLLVGCHEPTAVEYEEIEVVCVVIEADPVGVAPELLPGWVEVCTS